MYVFKISNMSPMQDIYLLSEPLKNIIAETIKYGYWVTVQIRAANNSVPDKKIYIAKTNHV